MTVTFVLPPGSGERFPRLPESWQRDASAGVPFAILQ